MRLFRALGGPAEARLDGERNYLRPPVERDWRHFAEIRAASRKFLEPWEPTWVADALTRDSYLRRLRRYGSDWRADAGYNFFLFRRTNDQLLGGISIANVRRGVSQSGSLGYWIGAEFARQGHMTEALDLLLQFCFDDLQLHRVEAACLSQNEASRRLLDRAGFEQEGVARKLLQINGEWHDHLLFAMLAESFTARGRRR